MSRDGAVLFFQLVNARHERASTVLTSNDMFYNIYHNTFNTRGMPWIQEVLAGWESVWSCMVCGARRARAFGDMKVGLKANRSLLWPDLMGCGVSEFVVSARFVDAMREDGIRVELGGVVEIIGPLRNRLSLDDAPAYFWVEGERLCGARMDREASGIVDVVNCRGCGRRLEDVRATSRREHEDPPPPITFDVNDCGLELFTTDSSPLSFYCSDRVLDCVKRNELTNVAFVPVERGFQGEPIKY